MRFTERSFKVDESFWPRPFIHIDDNQNLVIVVTPWGSHKPCLKIANSISEYFLAAQNDNEATSPFPKFQNLSSNANFLRIAAMLVNEMIYNDENRHEYKFGFELFAGVYQKNDFSWIQIGHPHVLYKQKHTNWLPINVQLSLSAEIENNHLKSFPLPNNLLGIELNPYIYVNQIHVKNNEKIALISREWLPETLWNNEYKDWSLEGISKALSLSQQIPFWAGLIEF